MRSIILNRKITHEDSKFVAKTIAIIFGTIGLTTVLLFYGSMNLGSSIQKQHNCEGIENFYSGEDFLTDYTTIMMKANTSVPEPPKSPQQLWDGELVDCDTISVVIMCVSEYYPEFECQYYVQATVTEAGELRQHLGVECKRNSAMGWTQYY